jgi:hypothetical protein
MTSLGLITKVGPVGNHDKSGEAATEFAIEVLLENGDTAILELTKIAARGLAKELTIYLEGRGSR